jgi:hypothetical protein
MSIAEYDFMELPAIDLELCRRVYTDASQSDMNREHAFYNYWVLLLADRSALSDRDLEGLLEHRDWIYPVADIVQRMCARHILTIEQIEYLKDQLAGNEFAQFQLIALQAVLDDCHTWQDRLTTALGVKADWAVGDVIRSISADDFDEAQQIVVQFAKTKRRKNFLLQFLKDCRTARKGAP